MSSHLSETLLERDAANAEERLRASMEQWTSPKLGTAVGGIMEASLSSSLRQKSDRYHNDDCNIDDPNVLDRMDDPDDVFMDTALLTMLSKNSNSSTPAATATQQQQQSGLESTKRNKTFHRSSTPIMSNNSKNNNSKQRHRGGGGGGFGTAADLYDMNDDDDDEVVPYNVKSPWMKTMNNSSTTTDRQYHHPMPSNNTTTTTIPLLEDVKQPHRRVVAATAARSTAVSAVSSLVKYRNENDSNYCAEFQPYYSAAEQLWRYHQQKQSQRSHPDSMMQTTLESSNEKEIMNMELHFIMTLHRFCWSSSSSASSSSSNNNNMGPNLRFSSNQMEGNFWLLLSHLRQLGMAAVVWDTDNDTVASSTQQQQHRRVVQAHVQSISVQTQLTPATILKALYTTTTTTTKSTDTTVRSASTTGVAPLPIQRRKQLLTWLQSCFQNIIPSDILRPRRTTKVYENNSSNDKLALKCGLYRTNKDDEILHACLSLLLAGRFQNDAMDLVRNSNLHWRAAVWGGSIPHGYTTTTAFEDNNNLSSSKLVSVGNPGRALWRRMMWKHSEQLVDNSSGNEMMRSSNDVEAAIAALLSSNVKLALDCAPLRSWECGLYTIIRCMIDRMEDDVLHRHNNYRRSIQDSGGPLYPGTEHETSEREHLQATYDMANLDEGGAIRILDSTPFDEMRGDDIIRQATASLIIGKDAIVSFVQNCIEHVSDLSEDELRFVTHFTFYLDALSYNTTTPVVLPNMKQWKNEFVMRYMELLASHEDLWYMIVLYASFLPVNTILDHLPSLLLTMESMEERKVIVQQLREFLPHQNLDLEVLRRTVALVISESEDGDEELDDAIAVTHIEPSELDIRKMESVLWLSIQNDHAGEALIAANSLLRKFFLSGHKKLSSAMLFVDEVLNDFLTNFVTNVVDTVMDDNDQKRIKNAGLEHTAYLWFLRATKSVHNWKLVVRETQHTVLLLEDETIDKSLLNVTERSIADNAEGRKIIDIKRTATQKVFVAAENACTDLRQILEHRDGWLSTDDEDVPPITVEDILRRKELDQLHCQLLPRIVFMYHDVCTGTASWMSKSLDDTAEALNASANDAVRAIDDTLIENDTVSSPFAPRFWTQKALELAEMTMNETYNVWSAFRAAEYKVLLSLLAETTAIDCMYRYAE